MHMSFCLNNFLFDKIFSYMKYYFIKEKFLRKNFNFFRNTECAQIVIVTHVMITRLYDRWLPYDDSSKPPYKDEYMHYV